MVLRIWNCLHRIHLNNFIRAKSKRLIPYLTRFEPYFLPMLLQNIGKNSNNVSRETIIQNLNRKLELVKDDYLLNTIDDNVDENNLRTITVKISNQHGIHARPASILVKLVQSFESTIWIRNSRKEIINAKDFLQILTMELKNNDFVEIIAQGKDAESALKCLEDAFNNQLSDDFYNKFISNL